MSEDRAGVSTYERLIELLDEHGARYRMIDHAPEGRTELVSRLRGHAVQQAAKCVVVLVKVDKKTRKYVLAVVPGHTRVDLGALKALYRGRYAGFADNETAERLSGSVSGTILPVTFTDELELVVDPSLLEHDEIFFNAARLDRSLALATKDFCRIAKPTVHSIAQLSAEPADNESQREMEINHA